eukprot:gene14426-100_t
MATGTGDAAGSGADANAVALLTANVPRNRLVDELADVLSERDVSAVRVAHAAFEQELDRKSVEERQNTVFGLVQSVVKTGDLSRTAVLEQLRGDMGFLLRLQLRMEVRL